MLRTHRRLALAPLLLLVTALPAGPAHAQIWQGAGGTTATPLGGNWDVADNWSPSGVPASSASTDLTFNLSAGAASYTSTANIASFSFDELIFDNANTSTGGASGGNSISIGGSVTLHGTAPKVIMNGSGDVFIAPTLNLVVGGYSFEGAGTGTLVLLAGITANQSGVQTTTKTSSGTLVLNGFSGSNITHWNVSAGTLVITGAFATSNTRALTIASGGTVQLGIPSGVSYAGIATDNGSVLGNATASASVNVQAGGTLNVYNTGTNLTNRLTDAGIVTVNGTANFYGNTGTTSTETIGHLAGAGSVVLNNGFAVTLSGASGSTEFSGVISGNGSIAIAGQTHTFSGANTYSGGTSLSGTGTLAINNGGTSATNSAIGTGTFTIAGGNINNTSGAAVTLATNNAQVWDGNFTFVGSNDLNLGTGAVSLTGNRQVTVTANMLSVGGVIDDGAGTRNLTKAGAGTLVLGNVANTYSGLTAINGGILNVAKLADGGASSSIGDSAATVGFLTFNGGTLQYTGGTAQSTNRLFTINTSGATLDASGSSLAATVSFAATGANSSGTGTGARSLTLAGSNIGDNTLAGSLGNSSGGGALSLIKSGAGTWRLTAAAAASSYSGGTSVTAGTLKVAGVLASGNILGTGDVTVAADAVLELSTAHAIADTATLTLADGATLRITGSFNETVGTLVLGATTINYPAVFSSANSYQGFGDYFAGSTGSLTVVPEPAAVGGLLGLLPLALRRRRRAG